MGTGLMTMFNLQIFLCWHGVFLLQIWVSSNIFFCFLPLLIDLKQQRRFPFLTFAELHQSRVLIFGNRSNKLRSLAGHLLQNIITVKEGSSKIPPTLMSTAI